MASEKQLPSPLRTVVDAALAGSGDVLSFVVCSLFLLPANTLMSDLVGKPEQKGQVG